MPNFPPKCCNILHLYQQQKRMPAITHPHQHLVLPILLYFKYFFLISILEGSVELCSISLSLCSAVSSILMNQLKILFVSITMFFLFSAFPFESLIFHLSAFHYPLILACCLLSHLKHLPY